MAELVRSLPKEILEHVEIRYWEMRSREGISKMKELKVKMLPALAINGKLEYEAIIPPQEELIAKLGL